MIPFNKPFQCGNEIEYIRQAISAGKLSGNGLFTKRCQDFFEEKLHAKKCLLTTSCTDALEMAAMLCEIKPGDEVIIPSYTFVSTALAFVREGATIVFADSEKNNPNIDATHLEKLITPRTKVIVPVHYAGVACNMDMIMDLARKHNFFVVEDAAQAIDSFYKGRPLGSIGHLATFSFHETKNIISGEGGLLVINDERFTKRSEILWEKGTNRAEFFRGEINKYGWVDVGSSFLPSEITAAYLCAQLEQVDFIQKKRKQLWNTYNEALLPLYLEKKIRAPFVPSYSNNNAHMYYILCKNLNERSELMTYLKAHGICSVFHYLSLHRSEYYVSKYFGEALPMSDHYTDCLLRLPMYYELEEQDVLSIVERIKEFFI